MDCISLAPGKMHLYPAASNPHGAEGSRLFLLAGDAVSAPIQEIEWAPGSVILRSPRKLPSTRFNLRIFHFNDLHGHLMHLNGGREEAVIPRLAWKVKSARQACLGAPNAAVLVISAGDDCGGSVFDELQTALGEADPLHPGYHLYSKLGVDLGCLGNHDLDAGIAPLADAIRRDARFPVLAANLHGCPLLKQVCHPAAILVVKGLRVGLIGLVTRAETHLDPAICRIVDPIPVAENLVTVLRPLCDVLVIVSHLGYSLDSPVPTADAGDVEVARSLPDAGVDLIIGGHSHTALNHQGLAHENIINGIPIVQAGARGDFLGQVDFAMQENQVRLTGARLIPLPDLPIDHDFAQEEVHPFLIQARAILSQQLGRIEPDPDFDTTVVINEFGRREMALANFVTDALVERLKQRGFQVDFSMIDASALQCGLPFSENITYGDCFELMPYADTIRLYTLTGLQLQDIFSDNALRLDHPDTAHRERGFLQFSREIRYKIYLGFSGTDACAVDISIHGIPLEELAETTFTIATSHFTRELALPWETARHHTHARKNFKLHQFPYTDTDLLLRQEIVSFIRTHGGVIRASGASKDGRLQIIKKEITNQGPGSSG